MKIRYAINARIPTPRAHGIQVMKTCEALARRGAEVELVVPARYRFVKEDPFLYYGVEPVFTITYLPTIEFAWGGLSHGFLLQTLVFTFMLARYLRGHQDDSLLYVRGELGWLLPLIYRGQFFWENHIRPHRKRAEARAVRRAQGIVVVTERYREDLIHEYGLSADRVLVAPDGVDPRQFSADIVREEARRRLGLPMDKMLAVYTGSDLPWKGVRYLREAAAFLPDAYEVVFVGQISPSSEPRQRFAGLRPYGETPLWLAAADVLVLTGDPASETARHYTSPIKLFEYMAARRPIVAVDLPSYREVLRDDSAIFATPGDPQALARSIEQAAADPVRNARIARALEDVRAYTWDRRAEEIRAFIRTRTNT